MCHTANMNSTYLHRLSLAVFGLGGLMLSACAVQQPMAKAAYVPVQKERPDRTKPLAMFAPKRIQAEPEPQPQAAAETPPEPQPQVVAKPAPKPRSPLTNTEENEIDTQVMP